MYASTVCKESVVLPGVRYEIRCVSYAGRLALLRDVRDLVAKQEFHQAGGAALDRLEAEIAAREVRMKMVRWGLVAVAGLIADGAEVAVADVLNRAPEAFVEEIAGAIEAQLSLTEDERKN